MPNLTDLSVRNLPEGLHFDERTPGFAIRVGKNRRTWIVVKQPNRTKVRLGHYPDLSLQDARRKALVAIGSPLTPRSAPPYPEARESFLAQDRWKDRTKKELARTLKVNFAWTKPVDKITHEDVAQALDAIDATSARRHAFDNLRIFFNWCIPRYITASPCAGYQPPSHNKRERVLTDDEIKRVWIASEQCGTFGVIVRLLLLTGQRRGEIAALQTSWIKDNQITLPAEITKNGREHTFPLSTFAKSVIVLPSSIQLIFPARGKENTAFNGWSKGKAKLDKLCGVTDWTLHDLRRTFATGLASLGVPIHVTEKLLNHISGTTGGLVGVYQRHQYWPEQVAAMQAWEAKVLSIVRA